MSRFAVLLVDKPAGPTSHDVVDFVRWALRERSVGHCGTLDPAATGLMVVCIGRATRLAEILTGADKVYEAKIALGRRTRTDDADGEVVEEAAVGPAVWAEAVTALEALVGAHDWAPPAFSALKVDGKRAHLLARRGEAVDLPARPMHVRHIRGARLGEGTVDAELAVSKGTYIRSLAVALGESLGVPAHLSRLRRTASGAAQLSQGHLALDATPREAPEGKPPRFRLRPVGLGPDASRDACTAAVEAHLRDPIALLPIPRIPIDDVDALHLLQGKAVPRSRPDTGPASPGALVALVAGPSAPIHLALAEAGEGGAVWKPQRVLVRDSHTND